LAAAGVYAAGVGADAMALGLSGGLVVPLAFSSYLILSEKVLRPEPPRRPIVNGPRAR